MVRFRCQKSSRRVLYISAPSNATWYQVRPNMLIPSMLCQYCPNPVSLPVVCIHTLDPSAVLCRLHSLFASLSSHLRPLTDRAGKTGSRPFASVIPLSVYTSTSHYTPPCNLVVISQSVHPNRLAITHLSDTLQSCHLRAIIVQEMTENNPPSEPVTPSNHAASTPVFVSLPSPCCAPGTHLLFFSWRIL